MGSKLIRVISSILASRIINVGKYTSPMDPSWGIPYLSTLHPVTLGASILRATPDPKYTGLSYTNEIHKEICKPFQPNPKKYVASWWLNQPLKHMLVKLDRFPNFRGKNKKSLSCHHPGRLFSTWDSFFCWDSIEAMDVSMYSCSQIVNRCDPLPTTPVAFLQARAQINGLSFPWLAFLRWPYPPVN